MRAPLLVLLLLAGCLARPAVPFAVAEPANVRLTPDDATASEVSLAADPTDPDHLVAAANSGGGFGIYVSRDGGLSWNATTFLAAQVDPRQGVARFRQLSDPAVAFGPDGTPWIAGLAYLPTSAVFVTRSADGGASWEDAVLVEESDIASSFNDKEWISVGPDGALIVAWQKELAMDQLRALDEAAGIDADFGDIVVSRSTDAGATWSDPAIVSSQSRFNNGTQVAFTPDGRAHLLWVDYAASTLAYASSEDSGATWSEPRAITDVQIVPPFPRYARMHTLPGFAASASSLVAVWHDARADEADVMAIASEDGGTTWGSPVRVPAGEGIQMYPAVAIGPDGRIHVTFYDSSPDPAYPRFRYAIASAAGPDLEFGAVTNASTETFTIFDKAGIGPADPDDEARGIGDYTGAAATTSGVFAAWADGRDEAPAIYAMRIAS